MQEKRRHKRIDLGLDNRPELFISDITMRRISLTPVNLSRTGVGFLSSVKFNIDAKFHATIVLPGTHYISGAGTIRFAKEFCGLQGYGMELDIDEESQNVIEHYVMHAVGGD